MKLTRMVRTLLVISSLGATTLIYAQEQRDDAKPQEPRPEATKPAGNEVNPPRQDETKLRNRTRRNLQNRMTLSRPAKRASPQIRKRLSRRDSPNNRSTLSRAGRAVAFLTTSSAPILASSILWSSIGQP